jgi:hypothetical protein
VTVKLLGPVAVPPAVVTDTVPVAAPGITKPTSCVPVFEITRAVVLPMVKAVGLARLVPAIVTSVPAGPLAGVKEVMVGVCANKLSCIKMSNAINWDLCFIVTILFDQLKGIINKDLEPVVSGYKSNKFS